MTTDQDVESTSTNVPVYFQAPRGVLHITGVGTIKGKFMQKQPTMVPSSLYLQMRGALVLAPLTPEYLTALFGHKRFPHTTFELDMLFDMKEAFVNMLAQKIGVDIKRTYTHAGRARKVAKAIKQRMGIEDA